MARLLFALVAAILLVPLFPIASAQASRFALDVQDLPEDIIVSPESGDDFTGARQEIDVVRYVQRVEGEDAVIELVFAGTPGEAGAVFDSVGALGSSPGEGFLLSFRWDAPGSVPATAPISFTVGEMGTAEATLAIEGSTLRITFPLPAAATCMGILADIGVRTSDAEYTEWISPQPNPCDETARLDGAQGDCPPAAAPSGVDPVVADFTDEEGDVRRTTLFGEDGEVEAGHESFDITHVTSRRDGDRIVQVVTFAGPRNGSQELRIQVFNRLDGQRDGQGEPEFALVPLYWRFAEGSQQDRSYGEFRTSESSADFATELDIAQSTYTFSWCASLIPADARCFGIEVVASHVTFGTPGIRERASPADDPCALAGGATPTPEGADEAPAGEETEGEPEGAGEEGANDSPGLGAFALLGALAALAIFRRR